MSWTNSVADIQTQCSSFVRSTLFFSLLNFIQVSSNMKTYFKSFSPGAIENERTYAFATISPSEGSLNMNFFLNIIGLKWFMNYTPIHHLFVNFHYENYLLQRKEINFARITFFKMANLLKRACKEHCIIRLGHYFWPYSKD